MNFRARRTLKGKILGGWLIGLCLVFLANLSAARGNENRVDVTIKDNGSTVTLQKGDLLGVTLPASPGTGFSWHLRKGSSTLLHAKGKPVAKKTENESGKVGAAEHQVFQFEAQGTGTEKLELEYVRPWEKDSVPSKTFSLTVVVK